MNDQSLAGTSQKLAYIFEEAAAQCGYSVRTLKTQVAYGNLLARYANTKGIIRHEDLADWLNSLPTEPKAGHRPVSHLEDLPTPVPERAIAPIVGASVGQVHADKQVFSSERVDAPARVQGMDGKSYTRPEPQQAGTPTAIFRTPEEVAPELGMSSGRLRDYCRMSGINTRLGKNRMMLHQDDVDQLVTWIRERQTPTVEEKELDPFR